MTHPGMRRGMSLESLETRESRLGIHPAMIKEIHSRFPTGETGVPGGRRFGAGEKTLYLHQDAGSGHTRSIVKKPFKGRVGFRME